MARAWSLKARPQGMPKHTDFAMIDLDQSTLGAGEVRSPIAGCRSTRTCAGG